PAAPRSPTRTRRRPRTRWVAWGRPTSSTPAAARPTRDRAGALRAGRSGRARGVTPDGSPEPLPRLADRHPDFGRRDQPVRRVLPERDRRIVHDVDPDCGPAQARPRCDRSGEEGRLRLVPGARWGVADRGLRRALADPLPLEVRRARDRLPGLPRPGPAGWLRPGLDPDRG